MVTVIKMAILFYTSLLIAVTINFNPVICMDISNQFDGMFGSMTKDSNNMKTVKDENGREQLHVSLLLLLKLLTQLYI